MTMPLRLFMLPGDLACDAFGVARQTDHAQVLRSFFNMIVWGAVAVGVAFRLAL